MPSILRLLSPIIEVDISRPRTLSSQESIHTGTFTGPARCAIRGHAISSPALVRRLIPVISKHWTRKIQGMILRMLPSLNKDLFARLQCCVTWIGYTIVWLLTHCGRDIGLYLFVSQTIATGGITNGLHSIPWAISIQLAGIHWCDLHPSR